MCTQIGLAEAFGADVGVDLGTLDAHVSEEFLDES